MKNLLTKFIEHIENFKINIFQAILIFVAIVYSRAFMEGIFEKYHTIGIHPVTEISVYNFFLHFPVYYLFMFFSTLILLSYIGKEKIEKIGKILLTFFTVILLPPILDLFITSGKGDTLFYFMNLKSLSKSLYGMFLIPINIKGVSYGLRIEILIACILGGVYIFIKTRKFYKSILSFIGIYLIIIFSGALPLLSSKLLTILRNVNVSSYEFIFRSGGLILTETQGATILFLFSLMILVPLSFFLYSPKKFRNFIKNLKFIQSFHFIGMALFGVFLAAILSKNINISFITNPLDYVAIGGLFISIFLFFQSAVFFEKVSDTLLDDMQSKEKGKITTREMSIIGSIMFFGSLLIAISISYVIFLLVMSLSLICFFYLSPPFRIKRFFPLSTLLISFASLITIILGFALLAGENAFYVFPVRIALLILIVFTITLSVRDLSNIKSDKKSGFFTIPATLGEEKGKIIISLLLLLGFLIVPLILGEYLLFIPAAILGTISLFVLIKHRHYNKIIGLCYVVFALFVFLSINSNKHIIVGNRNRLLTATGHFFAGNNNYEKGMVDSATINYKIAEEKGLENNLLLYKLGHSYFIKGETEKAIHSLRKSVSLEECLPDAKILLAQAYIRKGNPDSAIIICNNALRYGKHRAEFHMLKGKALHSKKDIESAIVEYKKSIALGEKSGNSFLELGNIYFSSGLIDRSIKMYTGAIKCKDEALPRMKRAEIYYRKGNIIKAIADLEKASQFSPENAEIKNNIAVLYYKQKNYRKAENCLIQALAIDSDYIAAYRNLADTYEKMGQYRKAELVRLKIAEINNSKTQKKI
jgi:tetratricopeptide (TPR) repeat protein/4-hydroxybenzoate polyprenyltransferase